MSVARINILDYKGFGQRVIGWAQDPSTRPNDLHEFEQQLTGIIEFPLPDYIKSLLFIQNSKDLLLIRLPPADLVKDSLDAITAGGEYRLPGFYEDRLVRHTPETMNNDNFFRFRVGDYTLAHCA